jgi:Tfp pilus assembly protein PilN
MIQFNLLPDIKIQYLRANRQKHIVMLISIVVIVVSVAALAVLLGVVYGVQKKTIADLDKDIKASSTELQSTPDLTKILTVQNQLKVLTSLHDQKPVSTRMFGYIAQATPPNVNNSRILTDFVGNTMNLSGTADSLNTINVFIDRLKATTYHTESANKTEKKAFSEVTLSSFGRDSKTATYTITLKYDPLIFAETDNVTFTITPTTAKSTEGDQ